MFHFCTYFDKNYLSRGLALFSSLQNNSDEFKLYILCMDDDTYTILSKLAAVYGDLIPIPLVEIEHWDDDLLTAKENRSRIEYYFTLSPILPLYILNNFSEIDVVTYLDADLYFYSNPKKIFQEFADHSILIIAHRFPKKIDYLNKYGIYNVQYQSFRNDAQGIACLNRWREQCLQWCYDYLDDDRFADQKYLNEWPELYDKLIVSKLKGSGVAPWNIGQYEINIRNEDLFVDDEEMIFFHFHALKKIFFQIYSTNYSDYDLKRSQKNLVGLYKSYIKELDSINKRFNLPGINSSQEIRIKQTILYQFIKQGLKGNLMFGS